MSAVTVLGLGVMGSALARVLSERGHTVTVWNRTAAKAAALVHVGVRPAATPGDAVRASPVVIVCVTDYPAAHAALEGVDLRQRTLVQLSTGSPADARAGEAWAKERGADYLDGAILATPRQIGTPASSILVSGSASAFETSRALVADTAGALSYLGKSVGAAAAFDLSFLSCLFGALIGFYHGLRLVESEGLGLDEFATLMDTAGPAMIQMLRHDADSVLRDEYEQPEATIEICHAALSLLARQAREAGLDGTFPTFAVERFEAGIRAGYGRQSPAALVKVLRAAGARSSHGLSSARG